MSTATHAPTSAAEELARRSHTPAQRVQHLLHSHPSISPALILVVCGIAFTMMNSNFAKPATLSLLVQQTAVIAALAIGQTLIILTAGIDLSVGAIAILAMMVMATVASDNGVPGILALAIGILLAVAAGALNGILVTRIGLPPFIVTLGTLSIFTAIALLYSSGLAIQGSDLPPLLNWTSHRVSIGSFSLTTGVKLHAQSDGLPSFERRRNVRMLLSLSWLSTHWKPSPEKSSWCSGSFSR